ncbi:hypothetical protein AAG906_021831 [Vitis piasezkii]
MLLQFTISPPLHQQLSGFPSFTLPRSVNYRKHSITCSISQIHSYGTVDYERRPLVKWNAVYRRISLMENPEMGSASVLNQWENEGKRLTKWELCRVVKELRKFKRFKMALEVYEWMNNRGERFRLSSSDAAIQLDLIAKVCGVSSAEDYFSRLPDTLKDKRIYGALLNAYGYATTPLPFNVMMTLYMNLKELDKVQSMILEMMNKNIQLDIYSYNIWLSSCESTERMEQVFEQMKLERTINPNWTTFSTMATMYIKLGQFEKAEECLKKVESRITNRDRMPYHYLISLYGSTGNKAEVYRAWNIYKSKFPNIPNMGYHALISSLIYEEWLSVKSSYDPRIGNLLLGCYVKEGCFSRGSNGWKPKPVNVSAFLDLCEEEADTATKEALMGLLRQVGCLEDEPYASLLVSMMGLSLVMNCQMRKIELV